jgi:hypothetical protein
MVIQLICGLYAVLYGGFTAYTIYMVFIGKRTPEQKLTGRLIYYHGQAWIFSFIAIAIITLSFIFATVILTMLGKLILPLQIG